MHAITCLLLYFFLHTTNSLQSSYDRYFTKRDPRPIWPYPLQSGWTVTSRLACAIKCLNSYPTSCHGYLYNKTSKLCVPCSGLTTNQYAFQWHGDEDFYFHDSCDSYPDFQYHSYINGINLVSTYVAYANTLYLNYTDAQTVCQAMTSHLFVAKTLAKYDLMVSITNGPCWIGLDDIVNEGTFVWIDNGQQINSLLKSQLFVLPQPDNANNNEDCVYKKAFPELFPGTLNDAPCTSIFSFVCENPHC